MLIHMSLNWFCLDELKMIIEVINCQKKKIGGPSGLEGEAGGPSVGSGRSRT